MTPVAATVALRATSWDAALAHALGRRRPLDQPAVVHSVHRRVVNLLWGAELVSVADDTLDDAPSTVRVPVGDWTAHAPLVGGRVELDRTRVVLPTRTGDVMVLLADAHTWDPAPTDLSLVPAARLRALSARLVEGDGRPSSSSVTPFGRAAARVLIERTRMLRRALVSGSPAAVVAAAHGLLGLGEGLTPSGDDILTGLAFLAAQPGMRLGAHRWAIGRAAQDDLGTTLLGITTLRHALRGRARACLHDLAAAIRENDVERFDQAGRRIRSIGHTSGDDLLTGLRLALDAESDLRDGIGDEHGRRERPLSATDVGTTRDHPQTSYILRKGHR